jgi:hypothetical protein
MNAQQARAAIEQILRTEAAADLKDEWLYSFDAAYFICSTRRAGPSGAASEMRA